METLILYVNTWCSSRKHPYPAHPEESWIMFTVVSLDQYSHRAINRSRVSQKSNDISVDSQSVVSQYTGRNDSHLQDID